MKKKEKKTSSWKKDKAVFRTLVTFVKKEYKITATKIRAELKNYLDNPL